MDANFLLKLRLSLVDIEILHFLASGKGSEMERIWSDAISVVYMCGLCFCRDLRFQ